MTNEMTSRLIKQSEAASYLGLSEATLERDRWRGGDIPYIRVGPRAIRYDLSQLNQYVERKTVSREVVNND
jgi:excisionase family DNA binding protein